MARPVSPGAGHLIYCGGEWDSVSHPESFTGSQLQGLNCCRPPYTASCIITPVSYCTVQQRISCRHDSSNPTRHGSQNSSKSPRKPSGFRQQAQMPVSLFTTPPTARRALPARSRPRLTETARHHPIAIANPPKRHPPTLSHRPRPGQGHHPALPSIQIHPILRKCLKASRLAECPARLTRWPSNPLDCSDRQQARTPDTRPSYRRRIHQG